MIAVVIETNEWFNKGEMLEVKKIDKNTEDQDGYMTTQDSKKRCKGYTVNGNNIIIITKESHPEYFL